MVKAVKCCKCGNEIVGFIAMQDKDGLWCENCLNLYTCEECGNTEDHILDGGLCDLCESDHEE